MISTARGFALDFVLIDFKIFPNPIYTMSYTRKSKGMKSSDSIVY